MKAAYAKMKAETAKERAAYTRIEAQVIAANTKIKAKMKAKAAERARVRAQKTISGYRAIEGNLPKDFGRDPSSYGPSIAMPPKSSMPSHGETLNPNPTNPIHHGFISGQKPGMTYHTTGKMGKGMRSKSARKMQHSIIKNGYVFLPVMGKGLLPLITLSKSAKVKMITDAPKYLASISMPMYYFERLYSTLFPKEDFDDRTMNLMIGSTISFQGHGSYKVWYANIQIIEGLTRFLVLEPMNTKLGNRLILLPLTNTKPYKLRSLMR